MTAEDWAPYGIGSPGPDGWYADYRPVPAHLRPEVPSASPAVTPAEIDGSWLALVTHWRLVVADLRKECGIDLHHQSTLAGSWLGVRAAIFSLLDSPTRLRAALTRR